ncbi:DUF7313 family protein [Halobacterium litoreum]|uniref:DUF7313 domain-containing protein n=1 Tax=Halobacterium litoreum TaxID=2039234 RepID=A0ABD5NHX8_9EURY|nr:hypothetical protein [Halobacterium litoreum]UHH12472.1 hypothetical protein LT972_09915 [Halobacterium litoreum]
MADPSVTLFGPLDTLLAPYIEWALLAIVLLNFVSRRVAHGAHKRQAEDGADALSRHPFHVFTLWGMVLLSFYYLTLHHHAGMVLSTLVLGTFITDIFEFEARKVEAREGHGIERPKGALLATTVTFLYVAFLSLFFVIQPYWTQVI